MKRHEVYRTVFALLMTISLASCGGDKCSSYNASYHFTFDGNGDFGWISVDCNGTFGAAGSGWYYTGNVSSSGSVSGTCGCNGGPCGSVSSGTFSGTCPTTSTCFGTASPVCRDTWQMSR